jgi:tetratricopeptide (TPR) repeat protein
MARALGNLGLIAWFGKDHRSAIARYSEAAEIWQELGDARGQSVMRQNLAIVHQDIGELEQALPMFDESVALARTSGDRMQIAHTLAALARMLVFGRPGDPRIPQLLSETLELSTELGERLLTAECLDIVAHFALEAGEPGGAAELIGAADAERARAGVVRKPDERPYFEQTERELARALGRTRYDRERSRGQRTSLEDAVALALECAAMAAPDPA